MEIAVPSDPLKPIREALTATVRGLDAYGAPYMLIGGVAVGQLTEPRATRDVDISLWLDDDAKLPALLDELARHGLKPRVAKAVEFATANRMLLLVHHASRIHVDVALAVTPYEEEAIRAARSVRCKAHGLTVPLPRPEDLVVMKAVAHREQDLADIAKILTFLPDLDVSYIRRRTREFAKAIGDPEIRTELERVLRRARPKPSRARKRSTGRGGHAR